MSFGPDEFLAAHNEGREIAQEIQVALDDLQCLLYRHGGFRQPRAIQWTRAVAAAERLTTALRNAPDRFEIRKENECTTTRLRWPAR